MALVEVAFRAEGLATGNAWNRTPPQWVLLRCCDFWRRRGHDSLAWLQRQQCQDYLTLYGPDFKPLTRFATDTADLADLAVCCLPKP